MIIQQNSAVSIQYTLTLDDGTIVDSSGGTPLTFIQGVGQIIPGLDKAMLGHKAGDSFSVTVPAAEAYGEYNPELVKNVPVQAFAGIVDKVEPGMQFQSNHAFGSIVWTVVQVNGNEVTLDGNHPLAGKNLNFSIDVVSVRPATPEELQEFQQESSCSTGGCSSCSGCH